MTTILASIASAIIAGCVTLIGVLISNSRTQAVLETKVDELTREVREHNNFAKRVPVLEEKLDNTNKRVESLEKEVKGMKDR